MRTRWGFIFSVRCVLHRLLRSENPPGLGFGIGYVLHRYHPSGVGLWYWLCSTQMSPTGALFFPSVAFYTDVTPPGFNLHITRLPTQMSPLRGWVLVLATFYTDVTPLGLGFGIGYVLHRCRPAGALFFRPLCSTQMPPLFPVTAGDLGYKLLLPDRENGAVGNHIYWGENSLALT